MVDMTEVVKKRCGGFVFSILKPSDGDRILHFYGGNWVIETDAAAFDEKMVFLMSISNTSLNFFVSFA